MALLNVSKMTTMMKIVVLSVVVITMSTATTVVDAAVVTTPEPRTPYPPRYGGREVVDWCSLPQDGTQVQVDPLLGGIYKVKNQSGDTFTLSNCDFSVFAYMVDTVTHIETDAIGGIASIQHCDSSGGSASFTIPDDSVYYIKIGSLLQATTGTFSTTATNCQLTHPTTTMPPQDLGSVCVDGTLSTQIQVDLTTTPYRHYYSVNGDGSFPSNMFDYQVIYEIPSPQPNNEYSFTIPGGQCLHIYLGDSIIRGECAIAPQVKFFDFVPDGNGPYYIKLGYIEFEIIIPSLSFDRPIVLDEPPAGTMTFPIKWEVPCPDPLLTCGNSVYPRGCSLQCCDESQSLIGPACCGSYVDGTTGTTLGGIPYIPTVSVCDDTNGNGAALICDMTQPNHDTCCNSQSYDSSSQTCCNGSIQTLDGSGNQECCGSILIDTTSSICCNAVEQTLSNGNECCGSMVFDNTQEYCCDQESSIVATGTDSTACSCVGIGQYTCEYKQDGDGIIPTKTAICRQHLKDNVIHYHNDCVDNDKLGIAGQNGVYDGDKVIANCGCCESIDDDNPSISAIDGGTINEIDQEWCLYQDCYAAGAPVCSKAGDKNAKVTLCFNDVSEGETKEKCEDPWWQPGKGGGDTLNKCGECSNTTRRTSRNTGKTKKNGTKGSRIRRRN